MHGDSPVRKLTLIFILFLIPIALWAQENEIPVKIVELPLPESAQPYQFESYQSYVEMDRPLLGDGFDTEYIPYISDDPADYQTEEQGGILVFKKVDNVERTPSEGTTFFTVSFTYTIFQDGAEPVVHSFSTVATGTDDAKALDKCFRNATIHVADMAGTVSAHPASFYVSSMVSGEYVLSCGKKAKIRKGDEFHVYSKRNGQDIGKIYVVNVKEDVSFAQEIHLKDLVLAGDGVERVNLLGFGSNFYYDHIFGDNLDCFGFYQEYFRGFRAFRFLIGTEYITGLDDNCWNIYGGLKTMWHLGYLDLSSLIYLGRGYADGDWRYTGGSIKLLAEITPMDWLKFGLETGYSEWLADHDREYSNYGGFLLGVSITVRY